MQLYLRCKRACGPTVVLLSVSGRLGVGCNTGGPHLPDVSLQVYTRSVIEPLPSPPPSADADSASKGIDRQKKKGKMTDEEIMEKLSRLISSPVESELLVQRCTACASTLGLCNVAFFHCRCDGFLWCMHGKGAVMSELWILVKAISICLQCYLFSFFQQSQDNFLHFAHL